MNQLYLDTARLLTQVAPVVLTGDTFAFKGGTAINLFVRDMPRLSVDLDLVFPDHRVPRDEALARIGEQIRQADARLSSSGFQVQISSTKDGDETKLFVRRANVEVKIEVNFVMRGTVFPVRMASLMPNAQDVLMADLEIPVVSLEDMYGGKLVAAMDRQHPRDLFDVMQLFAHEGITPGIRRAFVIYLACHKRPIHEVLFPAMKDIRQEYERNFVGMTVDPVALDDLLATRERLVHEIQTTLDEAERKFLLSLVSNRPDWAVLDIDHVDQLPAIQWKLLNLGKLQAANPKKFAEQHELLAQRLSETSSGQG